MATLKSLVDETGNIKNEIKTCHTNLKNNLSTKGVNISSSDKLRDLVDKIENISTTKNVVASDNVFYSCGTPFSCSISGGKRLCILQYPTFFQGSIRCSTKCSGYSIKTTIEIEIIRDGALVSAKSFIVSADSNNYVEKSIDLKGIQNNDIIMIYASNNGTSSQSTRVQPITFKGDFV